MLVVVDVSICVGQDVTARRTRCGCDDIIGVAIDPCPPCYFYHSYIM
jgi:hypothetical protein